MSFVFYVISKRKVPSGKSHIADLSLTRIQEFTILGEAISITMLLSAISCEKEHNWVIRTLTHSALSIPSKLVMKIPATVILFTYYVRYDH